MEEKYPIPSDVALAVLVLTDPVAAVEAARVVWRRRGLEWKRQRKQALA